MIPVSTSQYQVPHCQCMRAAVASILEIPLEVTPEGDIEAWNKWAAAHNGKIEAFDFSSAGLHSGYSLGLVELKGESPKVVQSLFDTATRNLHVVVLRDGAVAHDPHRDQSALNREVVQEQMIVPLDPAKRMTFRDRVEVGEKARFRRSASKFGRSPRRRQFIRTIRRTRAKDRWTGRLLKSWALIDAEECAA